MTAGLDLDISARLCASLDGLSRRLDREARDRPVAGDAGPITTPSFSFTNTNALVTATNPGFCPQSWGPNTGYYWALQRITVAGLIAATAAVPGVADGAAATIAAATAGNVSLPHASDSLTGFQISLSTVGSAAMTVTVSNVSGGPYIYTILTGGSGLTVTYPQPIPSSGTAPQVAWSSTAAAVGNVSVYGLTAATAAVSQDILTVYKGMSPSSATPQNAMDTLLGNGGYSQSVHFGTRGLILRPDESLVFAGTALAASVYYVNVEGIQAPADKAIPFGIS